MSIFAIGDTHLSLGGAKPMDVFRGWENHVERLERNWKLVVKEQDVVVIPGDISWAMTLEDAAPDLAFLNALPGTKLLMKGNHDYWWNTKKKMDAFLEARGFSNLHILHNNAYRFGNYTICGTRGWFYDAETDADQKVLLREAGRLRLSIEAGKQLGGELLVFLHYPPLSLVQQCEELLQVLRENEIRRCCYGHLHGASTQNAFLSELDSIRFSLVSADYLGFCPKLIEKI